MTDDEARFPEAGARRVAPDPERLPSPRRQGESEAHRFDDPEGHFVMRYLADTLRGCLIELFAQFRWHAEAERRIGAVIGVEDDQAAPTRDPPFLQTGSRRSGSAFVTLERVPDPWWR